MTTTRISDPSSFRQLRWHRVQDLPEVATIEVANVASRVGAGIVGHVAGCCSSPAAVSPGPESPRNDWAMALPMTTPAMVDRKLPAIMPPIPMPRPPMPPKVRSIVPGRRTSARVARRARDCGSSFRRLRRGAFRIRQVGGQLLQKHAALFRRELGKCFGVRLLDRFRRCGLQHVAIAGNGLLIAGLRWALRLVVTGFGCGSSSRPSSLSRIPTSLLRLSSQG